MQPYRLVETIRSILQLAHRSPCRSTISWTAQKRTYMYIKKDGSIYRPPCGGIFIPSSVRSLGLSDLVKYIIPIPDEEAQRKRFCVIFTTPSYASSMVSEDGFLKEAIGRIYRNIEQSQPHATIEIQTLCIVVDKLPTTRPIPKDPKLQSSLFEQVHSPPIGDVGHEGFAYLALPAEGSLTTEPPLRTKKGMVDFAFTENLRNYITSELTLRIPLANTVFHTGTPFVMTLSSWAFDVASRGVLQLSQKDVSHHTVRLTSQDTASFWFSSALSVPLVPLTHSRKVDGCMGNIVRSLINSEGESIPASTELEKIVHQYFKVRNEPARAITAWALIIPQTRVKYMNIKTKALLSKFLARSERAEHKDVQSMLWERLWRVKSGRWNSFVHQALVGGARLHRILSGGGGWGKNAGLLSLDPVPVTDAGGDSVKATSSSTIEGFDSFSSALNAVVQDGDSIQFFISPADFPADPTADPTAESPTESPANSLAESSAESPANPPAEFSTEYPKPSDTFTHLQSMPKKGSFGIEFGCIPSTMDVIPGGAWQETSTEEPTVIRFPGSFGALSEKGMMLTRRVPGYKAPDKVFEKVFRSMIDVPYSRLWVAQTVIKPNPWEKSIVVRRKQAMRAAEKRRKKRDQMEAQRSGE